ncbi:MULTISPECIES: vitamin K epoxide reductase family protein [Streptacidiphilus]|uniref:Vitamin K epoxide reductase family protein n=1 Tax=Streptacidiphilus cavernicola TaxID=3342716 RepID=A0ABV6UU28_9ACTN|nr:vitamin K epoxide reductase family protein [Streptacidiphilus jeojiense]
MSATATTAPAVPEERRTAATVPTGRAFALLLVIAGAAGLAASVMLTLDKIRLLENPNYVPDCNINPIISCGSVMRTSQASVFGFANSLLGIAGFAVVVTLGVGLLAGARYRRWFWLGLQAGVLAGIVFVGWLISQSLYVIGALCPYCMVVWTAMIPLFWCTTVHNLRHGVLPVPERRRGGVAAVARYPWVLPALCYLVVLLMVLNRFWFYWRTLL